MWPMLLSIVVLTLTGCKTKAPVPAVVSYEIQTDGELLTALTKVTENPNCGYPFGGDDNGILFFTYVADGKGNCNIYKKESPMANSMVQMTGMDNTYNPAYSKAADKIAFRMNGDIYTMPVSKGKALTQITSTSDYGEYHPCFSPDGKFIIYDRVSQTYSNGSYKYYTENSEIWIKNLQTGENMLLGKGYEPSFSADGKKIVYSKFGSSMSSIWIMDVDGENQCKITDNNTIKYAYLPRFSPDGKNILFYAEDKKDGNVDLYVIPVDGGDLMRLTMNKSWDGEAYWSTDGYIYFASDRGGTAKKYNIWRFKY